jgi:hypothetical protein
MRTIFLDNLPNHNGRIQWKKSINHIVKGIYEDILFEVKIIAYGKNRKNYLTIVYKNKEFEIHTGAFVKCALGNLLGKRTKEFKYIIGDYIENTYLKIIDCEARNRPNNRTGIYKYYLVECQHCKTTK